MGSVSNGVDEIERDARGRDVVHAKAPDGRGAGSPVEMDRVGGDRAGLEVGDLRERVVVAVHRPGRHRRRLARCVALPEVERHRARHAVYENNRTLDAVKALENNDVKEFGRLMNESHFSLRDDYEVTGKELDTLAEIAWQQEGVIGSRMTGAGFGGSTVSLVKNDAIEAFKKNVGEQYTEKIGYAPSFVVASISDGTHRIEE